MSTPPFPASRYHELSSSNSCAGVVRGGGRGKGSARWWPAAAEFAVLSR
jgi:hypothetical protein